MKYLVIDIGGSYVKYALMDEDNNFLIKDKFKTPQNGRDELVEAIGKLYDSNTDIKAISISMPGIINPNKGYVYMGGALSYNNDFYFKDALEKRCNNIPIYINNDAKCAATCEAKVGALKDVQDGMVIILGTMVGGGIILNHQVRVGKHFSAGETSYLITDKDAYPSKQIIWGNRCSALRLCRDFAYRKGMNTNEVGGEMVFKAVNEGDKDAIDSLEQYTKEIAVQIFNIQTFLDVETFAIGGGISAQAALIDGIKKHLDKMYEVSPYYVPKAKVVRCKFGNDANLIGALQYAL